MMPNLTLSLQERCTRTQTALENYSWSEDRAFNSDAAPTLERSGSDQTKGKKQFFTVHVEIGKIKFYQRFTV